MRTVKNITDNKFLNIKEVRDMEKGVGAYFFAERLGVDSVAFVCYDDTRDLMLLNKEYKPPVDQFIVGAFGGSLDKDKSLKGIVVEEVREEAGFEVGEDDIKELGKVLVSTQMNQFCHLYIVFVNRDDQKERKPENAVEALATTDWVKPCPSLYSEMEDWKPLAIITKAEALGYLDSESVYV